MSNCTKCGQRLKDGTKFCTECGAAVNGCPKCGQPIADGIKFCTECGTSALAPEEPSGKTASTLSTAPDENPAQPAASTVSTSRSADLHFSELDDQVKEQTHKPLIVVSILLLLMIALAIYFAIRLFNPVSEPGTATATPAPGSHTESPPPAIQPPTQAGSQPESSDALPVQMEELPLFRLVRGNDHFYTTNCSEKNDAVARYRYSYEGVQAYVFSSPSSHIVPLYRLYNSSIHFYTADQDEEQKDLRSGWQLEGTMGYVANAPRPNLVPLYRSRASNGGYLYTTDLNEWNAANANGGIGEEITGWVAQNHDDPCNE